MTSDDRTAPRRAYGNPRVSELKRILCEYAKVNEELTQALNIGHMIVDEFRTVNTENDQVNSSEIGVLFLSFQQYVDGKFEELETIASKLTDI